MSEAAPARHLDAPVLALMLFSPPLFCWLLLRRGYSRSLRQAGFTYAGVMFAVGMLGRFG